MGRGKRWLCQQHENFFPKTYSRYFEPFLGGGAATATLRTLIGSEPVRCEGNTYDRYKRLIATCYSGGIDLNAELVRLGWALAYRKYSEDYIEAEVEAKEAKRGMWAGEFEPPWEWRRR